MMYNFVSHRSYANNKIGNKIIIEVSGETPSVNFAAYRRVYFDPSKSYILSGKSISNQNV